MNKLYKLKKYTISYILHMDKNNLIKLEHKITYNDPQLHEKFKITDEREKEHLHDVIYKYDLLSIFGLHDFLEEQII